MKYEGEFKETEIGKIPEDWEIISISEVAQINESGIGKEYKHNEIEYIDIDSVEEGSIKSIQKLKLSEAPSRAKRIVKDNDILISTVRPNLKHFAIVLSAKSNTIASTGFAVISAKKIDSKFLYYYLTTEKYTKYLSAIADSHTSTYPSFNPDIIENSKIPYPHLPEQHAISKILSDLDAKIELNRQMNATLEKMADTLFKHWFIEFEFPNKEGKPYRSSGGKMVESDIGKMPKDWKVGQIADEFNLVMGQSPPGSSYNKEGDGSIFFQGRTDFGFRYPSVRMFCNAPTRFANEGDTLVSVRAPVGDINMTLTKCCIGRGLAAIRHKTGSRSYTYYTLKNLRPEFEHFEARGTVFGCINKTDFENLKILIPPTGLIKMFEEKVFAIDQQIEINASNMGHLSQIRDSLLPKLMSGQIRVFDGVT